jgi:hypothetical protein
MRCEIKVVGESRKPLLGDGAQLLLIAAVMFGLVVVFLMGFASYRDRVATEEAVRMMGSLDAEVRRSDEVVAEKLKVLGTLVPLARADGLPMPEMVVDDPVAELNRSDLERKKGALAAQWEMWQALEGAKLKEYWDAHGKGLEMPEAVWYQMARVLQAAGEFGKSGADAGGDQPGMSESEFMGIVGEMREVVRMRCEAVEMRLRRLRMDGEFATNGGALD